MFVWEASVYDVYELSSQVIFHVSVPWGIVPNDFSFTISVARWLWVVCELVSCSRSRQAPSGTVGSRR